MSIYDQDLDKNPANCVPLSPVSFLERSGEVYADLPAIVHGARRYSWAETRARSARLAGALAALGVQRGSTVSAMLSNTPEMLELHYAVPGVNAVLHAINTRLDAPLIAWQMQHCETQVLFTDREFSPVMARALAILRAEHGRSPLVIDVCDGEYAGPGERIGAHEYEALLAAHAAEARLAGPQDEWDAIAVSYTSGTTGNPKGVVTHHRGAYLNAISNALTWSMPHFPRYLWTLPLFHCNGWCFPWTVALLGGTHVCLRKVEVRAVLAAMARHGVDHYCAAPIVHNQLIDAESSLRSGIKQRVRGMVAGAAPPAAMIEGMARIGFELTHTYGLTETYGPAAVAAKRASWGERSLAEQTRLQRSPGGALRAAGGHDRARPGEHARGACRCAGPGRGHVPRQHTHEGLPQESRCHTAGLRGRLVPQRRPGRPRARSLREDPRPQQGRHHFRRREHQLAGGRGRPVPPPGGSGVRGGGAAGCQVG